jgi:4-amino-4-deoxy-L-arabinose transferase-like glycosyltransferase
MSGPRPDRHRLLGFAAGLLSVLFLAAGVTLVGIAEQPFYTKGEPREAMVVWEMSHGGSLVLPFRNGTEIPSKPPFYHWLALVVSRVAGEVSELTARLPSALLSIAAALAVYAFGAWTGRLRSGWIAAVALVLCFEWMRAARIARVDMTLTFFLFSALLCFAIMDRTGVTRLRLAIFYACIAAATLGKGPVGIALPAAVIGVYALVRPLDDRESRVGAPPTSRDAGLRGRIANAFATLRALAPLPGIAAVLIVAGGWYAAALWIGGDDFFVKQVLKENVFRVLDPERLDTGHVHGPLYFIPNFLLGALPWSLLLPAVAWWLWRMRPVDATTRFLVVWFLTVIAFFSVSSSKRSVYILPAYPAAALLLGRILGPGPEGEGPRRLAGLGFKLSAIAVGVLGVAGLVLASGIPVASLIAPLLKPDDAQGLAAAVASLAQHRWIALLASAVAIACAAAVWREAPGAHWLRGSVALAVGLVVIYGGIASPVERGIARSRTLGPFMLAVRDRVGSAKLGFLCTFDYGAVFYSQRYFPAEEGHARCEAHDPPDHDCRDHIRELVDEKDCADPAQRIAALHAPDTPPYILVWEDEIDPVRDQVRVLMQSEGTGPKGRAHMLLVEPRPVAGPEAPGAPS